MCGSSQSSSSNNNSNDGTSTRIPKLGSRRKIAYSLIDVYHTLCLDKKDITQSELCACEKLLDNTIDDNVRVIIKNEISELRMVLDLIH
jgi:ribosome assembly protein YihI (activator of Der GTPase)